MWYKQKSQMFAAMQGKKNLKCSFFSKYSAVGVETRGEWVKMRYVLSVRANARH